MIRLILISFLFIFSVQTYGRTFKNAYISFEMLDNWKCQLEQTEWVCRAEDPQESKEAVIILTAKEKGPTDTFELYQNHMSSPITTQGKSGSMTSTVIYKSTQLKMSDHPWLDALHTNSEVQNYYTRYLATTKDQIAILVTFSAHNKYYAKHSTNFNNTVKSLRVIASKDILSRPDLGPFRGSGEQLGDSIGRAMPSDLLAPENESSSQGKGYLKNPMVIGFIILLLAAIAFVVLRFRKKN